MPQLTTAIIVGADIESIGTTDDIGQHHTVECLYMCMQQLKRSQAIRLLTLTKRRDQCMCKK